MDTRHTQTHIVRRGETLTSIAKLQHCTVDELASANQLSNKNQLAVGQVLTLPHLRHEHLPPAKLNPRDESKAPAAVTEKSWLENLGDYAMQHAVIKLAVLDSLLNRFRVTEANENIQHTEPFAITKQTQPVATQHTEPRSTHSQSGRKLADIKAKLREQLGKEPHVTTLNGVRLTENERRQIMASVATCEMNSDGFGSINADSEFAGRKFGHKGIEVGYSRIVHIGLSYGIIQFTQDGGMLGRALAEMQKKNAAKFTEIFGGGDSGIAQSLITLTTIGRQDLVDDENVPLSGQQYWNTQHGRHPTKTGKELHSLANVDKNNDGKSDLPVEREIRGRRVQPIKATASEAMTDIWTGTWKQRFLAAGQITDFQEAQLALAVSEYMNPILAKAKQNNVRSASALAFIAACSVRGGAASPLANVFYGAAKGNGTTIPFENTRDELKTLQAIANANGKVGNVAINNDESRRARLLMKDELGFLAEDLYDTSTY
jgi:LysM repeat protein